MYQAPHIPIPLTFWYLFWYHNVGGPFLRQFPDVTLWYQKRYLYFIGIGIGGAQFIKNSILYVLGYSDFDSDVFWPTNCNRSLDRTKNNKSSERYTTKVAKPRWGEKAFGRRKKSGTKDSVNDTDNAYNMQLCNVFDCRFAAQMTDFGQHLPKHCQTVPSVVDFGTEMGNFHPEKLLQ